MAGAGTGVTRRVPPGPAVRLRSVLTVARLAVPPLAVLPVAACGQRTPATWPWPASPCPPGMVFVEAGTFRTGMEPPLPYAVVDTTKMEVVDAPERLCPDALAANPGTTVCWVQTDLHDPVVTAHEVTVQGFCIDRYPFPGSGAPNPPDGLTTWDATLLDEILSSGRFGPRRMCTFTEYEVAVAGPRSNHRYVYGDDPDPSRCPTTESDPIGSHPGCCNPETGVCEYGAVVGQWVEVDPQMTRWACEETDHCRASGGARLDARTPEGAFAMPYVVAGGTHRNQTRQAPHTPHTWHDHGQATGHSGCDDWGWDDGAVVCADPDPRYAACAADPRGPGCEAAWKAEEELEAWLRHCRGERMTDCLTWGLTRVRGRRSNACPERPDELGPGQGR